MHRLRERYEAGYTMLKLAMAMAVTVAVFGAAIAAVAGHWAVAVLLALVAVGIPTAAGGALVWANRDAQEQGVRR